VLFFAFLLVRVLTESGGTYDEFKLYYLNVNYHLGNVFVTLHGVLGTEFSPITQSDLGLTTGVYDQSGWGPDPLVGGFSGAVPVVGNVAPVVSIGVGVMLTVMVLSGQSSTSTGGTSPDGRAVRRRESP
jgi:ABC-2 type transport system permease protein